MGANQVYRYDGRVDQVQLNVSETVFDSLDRTQAAKVCGGTNYRWNEIIWFYPVEGIGPQENSQYLKINTKTGAPDIGPISRATWQDSGVFDSPIAASPDGILWRHEQPAVFPTVQIEFTSRKYPTSTTYRLHGPYQVVPTTEIIHRRLRGRCVSMKISGTMKCGESIVPWFIESGIFDIQEGNEVMQVSRIIPDFAFADAISIGAMRFDVQADGEQ
jgi:hypothetical protein